jgi:hypothetical protein
MKERDSVSWSKEYAEFAAVTPVNPPEDVSERVRSSILSELSPSAWKVFGKVALIHLFTGGIGLLFCPQFGISITGGMGLSAIYMLFGPVACSVACGATFLGFTAVVASLLLRPEEIRVIRKTRFLQLSVLGLLSIGAFLCLGAVILEWFTLAWLFGSIMGGAASFECGWAIRLRASRH